MGWIDFDLSPRPIVKPNRALREDVEKKRRDASATVDLKDFTKTIGYGNPRVKSVRVD
jgi:hypothetical protein